MLGKVKLLWFMRLKTKIINFAFDYHVCGVILYLASESLHN